MTSSQFTPRLIAWMLVLCAVSTFGCDSSEKPPEDAALPVDHELPDGAFADVVAKLCDTLDRCPKALRTPFVYETKQECIAALNFRVACEVTNLSTESGLVRRPVDIDESSARACIVWLEVASCTDLNALGNSGPCAPALAMTAQARAPRDEGAAVGEPCVYSRSCEPDAYCSGGDIDVEAGVESCKVCAPRKKAGERCKVGSCETGSYCKTTGEATDGVCSPPEPDGSECTEGVQCESGWCKSALGETGVCDPNGQEGDACDEHPDCRGGNEFYHELFCASDKTCQEPRANGEPCVDSKGCAAGSCHAETGVCGHPDGDRCASHHQCASSSCVDGTCGGIDGACFFDAECGDGEVCASQCPAGGCFCKTEYCEPGICRAVGEGGCRVDSDCPAGIECYDGGCYEGPQLGDACEERFRNSCGPHQCVNGVCVAKGVPGDFCDGPDSCVYPYICLGGRCEVMNLTCSPAPVGQRCAGGRVCEDGAFCDVFGSGLCKPLAKLGEPCQLIEDDAVRTCETNAACAPDESTGSATCRKRGASGEACVAGLCAEGLLCHNERCFPEPAGRPCEKPAPASCPDGNCCGDGHYCGNQSICLPSTPAGGECHRTEQCAEGLFCSTSKVCEALPAPLPEGAACGDDAGACDASLYCDKESEICVVRPGKGERCEYGGFTCAPGLNCSAAWDLDCDSGTCLGRCVEAQCVP